MSYVFFCKKNNRVLEPAAEVLPQLWIGRESGRSFEAIAAGYPALTIVHQRDLPLLNKSESREPPDPPAESSRS